MQFKKLVLACVLICVFSPTRGFALIRGQLWYKASSGDFKPDAGDSKSLSASGLGATLLLDPVPLLPVGFGLSLENPVFSPSLADHGINKLEGYVISPEIQAWLPFLPIPLIPYARMAWALGTYKAKSQLTVGSQAALDVDFLLTSRGTQFGVGFKYEPIPLPIFSLALLAEINAGMHTFADRTTDVVGLPSGLSADDIKSSFHKASWSSTSIVLGLEAGF